MDLQKTKKTENFALAKIKPRHLKHDLYNKIVNEYLQNKKHLKTL